MQSRSSARDGTKEQFSYRLRKWLLQRITSRRGSDQHRHIAEVDWDVLVVLDACRLDTCRQALNWPVDRVTSPASCTPRWLERVDSNGLFDHTAILTANPKYEMFEFATAAVEDFWRSHWNDTLRTVLPEPILDRATELLTDQNTPVVAHLQQPHWPYVAKVNDSWHLAYRDVGPWTSAAGEITSMQVAMARSQIDVATARQAYRASVHSVWETLLPYVEDWLSRGLTTIVTADHGETFGRLHESTMYEHPCRCNIRPLVSVPWAEFRPSTAGEAVNQSDNVVQNRLEALGYTE